MISNLETIIVGAWVPYIGFMKLSIKTYEIGHFNKKYIDGHNSLW